MQKPRSTAVNLFLFLAVIAWMIFLRQWFFLPVYAVIFPISIWVQRRPPTVIDRSGIRRPGRLRRRVAWSDVDAVAAPQPGVFPARLVLANGKFLKLDDIPASDTAAVAALGGKPILPATPPPTPPPRPVIPTDQEICADASRFAGRPAHRPGG